MFSVTAKVRSIHTRPLPGVDLAILHTRSHLYNPLFRNYAGIGFVSFLSGTTYNCVLIH